MIQLTGVASRYVGYYIAAFLVLLGLFPAVGLVFSLMPEPVLGGATLLMFGTVAAAGIRIIAAQEINRKATLVMAVSFSLGLSVELVPEILCQLPETLRNIFSSGITTGGSYGNSGKYADSYQGVKSGSGNPLFPKHIFLK